MKAIVLSSGGIDSTTCISLAVEKYGAENVVTLSIFYGQKHNKELVCAQKIAAYYKLKHYEFNLKQILQYSNSSLLSDSTETISHKSYAEQISERKDGIVSTYVPFRNGLMLSVCASLAMSLFPNEESMRMTQQATPMRIVRRNSTGACPTPSVSVRMIRLPWKRLSCICIKQIS